MTEALNTQREKLESPTNHKLNSLSMYSVMHNFQKDVDPIKIFSKMLKSNEKTIQQMINRNKTNTCYRANPEKEGKIKGSYLSERDYSDKKEIVLNSNSYKYTNKYIFSMPQMGFITEKYKLRKKSNRKRSKPQPEKTKKSKNFTKKQIEFKDEIMEKQIKQGKVDIIREELMKGRNKEKIKAVQSMCSSKIENITDSNIFIIKTRSGQEIKTKKALDDVKSILQDFKRDLRVKQTRMREKHEDIQELRASVKRLQSDLQEARKNSRFCPDIHSKETEIKEKTQMIQNLENETLKLSEEIGMLTDQMDTLKRENEENLKEVTQVVKRKFREIESRNKKERQVQKDILLKYNLELETKNEEINGLIGRYQELRLLNQDLSREITSVKKKKDKKEINPFATVNIRERSQIKRMTQQIHSKTSFLKNKLKTRVDFSEASLIQDIMAFETAMADFQTEIVAENERLMEVVRDKELSKKQMYHLERTYEKKLKELSKSKSKLELQHQIIKIEVSKTERRKSLESKHRMLKQREETICKFRNAAQKLNVFGKKLAKTSSDQIKNMVLMREEAKRKEKAIKDQRTKEKYSMKINGFKEDKLLAREKMIKDLSRKIGILQNKVKESEKFQAVRNKSTSRGLFSERKNTMTKQNKSSNNVNINNTTTHKIYNRKKLYRGNINKHIGLMKGINLKYLTETLDLPRRNQFTNRCFFCFIKSGYIFFVFKTIIIIG